MSFPIRKIGMLKMPKIAMLSTIAEIVNVVRNTDSCNGLFVREWRTFLIKIRSGYSCYSHEPMSP